MKLNFLDLTRLRENERNLSFCDLFRFLLFLGLLENIFEISKQLLLLVNMRLEEDKPFIGHLVSLVILRGCLTF